MIEQGELYTNSTAKSGYPKMLTRLLQDDAAEKKLYHKIQ